MSGQREVQVSVADRYRCQWQKEVLVSGQREVQVSVAERGTSAKGREWYRCWGFKVLMDIY